MPLFVVIVLWLVAHNLLTNLFNELDVCWPKAMYFMGTFVTKPRGDADCCLYQGGRLDH